MGVSGRLLDPIRLGLFGNSAFGFLLQGRGGEPLVLQEQMRCDEAQLPVRVLENAEDLVAAPEQFPSVLDRSDSVMPKPIDQGRVKARVLRKERHYSLLYQLGDRFTSIVFKLCCPAQYVARCTGECFYLADEMDRAHLIDELGDQFDLHQRSVAADGDGALSRSERAHMATYPGKLGLRKYV